MTVLKPDEAVSRRRYTREQRARQEAERLLEEKSRALWEANEQLKAQASALERTVEKRTKELHKAMRSAEDSSQAKSIFLASMSHEIRTPLNGVLGMAQALTETSLSDEQEHMAQTIVDSGQILLSVLNDILDISKIEAGQLEIEKLAFDLPKVMEATRQLYAFKALEKNLQFELTVSPSASRWVKSDPVRLRQVAGNLISNAIKFTASGTVRVAVDLAMEGAQDVLSIAVHDTGEGMPEAGLKKLFQPFQQLDASVNRRHGGTGLGLSISRQICRLMDGDILVESVEGEGSSFTAKMIVELAEEVREEASQNTQEAEEILLAREWRVLIAEDNKTNQLVFRKLMKAFPLQLTMVENGQLAVDAFRGQEFDLVLMDINMPVMSGIEAAIQIRREEECKALGRTPILALTANSMSHQVASYLASGMDGHIAKPVRKVSLICEIAKALKPKVET